MERSHHTESTWRQCRAAGGLDPCGPGIESHGCRTVPEPGRAGEAEAIALAIELDADVLLIDERRARKAALGLGLPVTGVLGLLLEAKKRGAIAAIKPILDQMETAVAFRLKRSLYDAALRAAGE